MCVPNIFPSISVVYTRVPVYGVTQLGFRSHSTGSSTPEALTTTFSFFMSDKLVYTTTSFRPISPCQDTQAQAGPVLTLDQYPAFSSGVHDIQGCLYPGLGAYGDSQISGTWTHSDCKLHINSLEVKAVILPFRHWVTVLQGHQVMDNTTVVSYINNRGGPIPTPCYV